MKLQKFYNECQVVYITTLGDENNTALAEKYYGLIIARVIRILYDSDAFHLWTHIRLSKAPSTPATMSKQQATLSKQRSTLSKKHSTLLPQTATMPNEISSFRQSRNKLNMFNLFRHCRKDGISFDIVAETGNIVAKNGNNVEATFDTVKRIVQLVAFDNVASTLLLVWTAKCDMRA